MDRHRNDQLRTSLKQQRRRMYVMLFGFLAFVVSMYSITDPDDTLTLAIGLVFYFVAVLLLPDRWFGRRRPALITDGPRPALRSQPPPPPARERLLHWPQREEPLPPLPKRRRRR